MFDRCRAWRVLLTRRADGVLSPSERALLDNHSAKCAACHKAQMADEALQSLSFAPELEPAAGGARAFDDHVISALRAAPLVAQPAGWREKVRACAGSLSFEFCMQLAGGGLAAASVTAFALISALNPAPATQSLSAYEVRAITAVERNRPPVPLESLFQSSTPRAAMLWAAPAGAARHPALEAAPRVPSASPHRRAPRRHGATGHGASLS